MGGGYEGLPLFPRHNSSANTQIFRDSFGTLAFNRVFYAVLALALVVLSMLVYEMKRKGKLRGYAGIREIFRNRKINIRHNFLPHWGLAVLILILTPVIFGITKLDEASAAMPLEMFVSLIGVILLVPVFLPEQKDEVWGLWNPNIQRIFLSV